MATGQVKLHQETLYTIYIQALQETLNITRQKIMFLSKITQTHYLAGISKLALARN